MANQKQQLEEIVASPFSSDAEKQSAQQLLDAMNRPHSSAPAALAPAPKQAPRVRHYMDWIPSMTDEESSNFLEMQASVRARVFAAAAAEKAEAAAKIVAPAPTRKEQLLALVNDATAPETEVLAAKIELAQLEIDEFNQSGARRTTESQV